MLKYDYFRGQLLSLSPKMFANMWTKASATQ